MSEGVCATEEEEGVSREGYEELDGGGAGRNDTHAEGGSIMV